MNVKYF